MTPRDGSPTHRGGDAAAEDRGAASIEELVREHRAAAVAYARRVLGDADLAEDAAQRALLHIALRVRAGDRALLAANPRAVVLRGTRWAALKIAERHQSRADAERRAAGEALAMGDDNEEWDRVEARMLVEDILPELPEHYRDVLRLRFLEDRPDAHAAEDLAVTVKAYRRRLDRALVVARMAAVRMGVGSLGALLPALLRRGRLRGRRVALDAAGGPWVQAAAAPGGRMSSAAHIAVAVAVVGLFVGPAASQLGGRGEPQTPATRAFPAPGLDAAAVAAAAAGQADGATVHVLPTATSAAHVAPAGPPSGAAGEGIQDIEVDALVPAPHASENHTAVAAGYGRHCACHLVAQTTDGGATWKVYPGEGDGMLLPPDYPRDPRIVFRYGVPTDNAMECIAPSIAARTCTTLPLTSTNPTVLDPEFDAGSPVIYASTAAGVVAYDVDTGKVRLLQLSNGTNFFGAPISAAGGSGHYAVYMLYRGTPVPQAQVSVASPTAALPIFGSVYMVGCPRHGPCDVLGDVPGYANQLFPDRDDPSGAVMAAVDQTGGTISITDAGATQHALTLSGNPLFLDVQFMGLPGTLRLSTLILWSTGHLGLGLWDQHGGWQVRRIDNVAPPVTVVFQAAMGAGRLIVADSSFDGVHCSTDGGATWAYTCPAAG